MRFDSIEFLVFFAVVLVLHRLLPPRRWLLVLASYAFYASWNPPFVLLLLFSSALDFMVGRALGALPIEPSTHRRRRALLGLSVLGNLGVLAYFKYVDFALDNLVAIGLVAETQVASLRVHAVLPLGISFYTFQTLSYSIDVYRGRARPVRSVGDFLLFVSFFPQLVAGPILRSEEFVPQIHDARLPDRKAVLEGVELCLVGLFKKAVIADSFANVVDVVFANPEHFSGWSLLVGSFCFNCQIYCDFSGYSTMARGLARLLGYEIPRNFDFPLLATNPLDYRRGWHVTMGNWFRDYLYRPLGGDRGGEWKTARNSMITWMAFGLWHGASWTFVLWGALNGLLLVAYRLLKMRGLLLPKGPLATGAGLVAMPVFLSLSTIAFRAQDVRGAFSMYQRILTWADGDVSISPLWLAALAVLYGIHWLNRRYQTEGALARVGWPARVAFVSFMVSALSLGAGSGAPFYYFQF
ncbi:MAG: MBOAT family O-acyltransferase [Polyangiales bacterium]|nr:MBOAT family protein [Myxococcales bacterium]MCB9662150.1 MBOAT family protein [Sandaracinaceae bacterium]